ncbi:formate C-acetyltransferase [Heliobacterium gestii]|uniref:Formate acetyltransferase n=1 Tax=Heliomicrobium gestii TaxID=2699 RepID=A0A845LDB5_HELGE|nr:formate C-acetyltransferase [Heliomicrobium gestii]MBM7866053.1 formate C-acetyltransferase [Heliomicrobium gestii]MZP42619.1 formate C-acetyltransferase [Heliomicrobium gestii]
MKPVYEQWNEIATQDEAHREKQASSAGHPWADFRGRRWRETIDVRQFIQDNYQPYNGDADFLAGPTERTQALWAKVSELMRQERERGGVLDVDPVTIGGIGAHGPGYIDKELERIVGLQTDAPLKRAILPKGGIRMTRQACEAYGYTLDPRVEEIYTRHRKTHNQAVMDVYTPEMRQVRRHGLITGLPDAYGRGRIIGDYRRVALYGVDRLIEVKRAELDAVGAAGMGDGAVRLREELGEQIAALGEMADMAAAYGFDIRRPAANGREAVQWLYFAYLAAVQEQNGAAMSIGRVSTFLDIYLERDLRRGVLTEEAAQELMDDFVIKLRMVRFLRPPAYNELFSGDPTWVTESVGGMGIDGRTLVTKNSYRILYTLSNLGPAPEPNLTVLWSEQLPDSFKRFCAQMSITTSAIQYENDDLMRPYWGDDYGIACCVSAMRLGKQMQFFGARANLAKALLYAINGGRDEKTGEQVGPRLAPIEGDILDFDEVMSRYDAFLGWTARVYMDMLNIIHTMHDRYAYERSQMALHDRDVLRTMACGIAGLAVAADSLSAIKHARVRVKRNETGLAIGYEVEGDYPAYGNDDARADAIAVDIVRRFMNKLRRCKTYRSAVPTLSVLTITSNIVYGKKTGATPDGRRAGEAFPPGANPVYGRDRRGALAALNSVAKLPYADSQDGISYTFSIIPQALGTTAEERGVNLTAIIDGYFQQGGHHINVNVLVRETLLDAMDHPEKYPQLTVRVSGYAVNFIKLTREQQLDVIRRTFFERV